MSKKNLLTILAVVLLNIPLVYLLWQAQQGRTSATLSPPSAPSLEANESWARFFKVKFDEGLDSTTWVFDESIKELDGKKIKISGWGYFLSMEEAQSEFMLSALPPQACYFCGAAGPETVMLIQAKKPVPFSGEVLTFEGTLRLNYDNVDDVLYTLEDAELRTEE